LPRAGKRSNNKACDDLGGQREEFVGFLEHAEGVPPFGSTKKARPGFKKEGVNIASLV
jgi:hypothetical protein